MKLRLDCGNTRLKWAVSSPGVPDAALRGVCDYAPDALADLHARLARELISGVVYASVITPEQEQRVLAPWHSLGLKPQRFVVTEQVGTLANAYATPHTLGVDRWAAAIGAWHQVRQPCLVISAGTATTVDLVEAQNDLGLYRGGLILPGVDLMLQSLHQRTARLPAAAGRYCRAPEVANNTHDAMVSGAIEATCGAIERMATRLPAGAPRLVTGGNAQMLADALPGLLVCDDLVLTGLAN